MFQNSGSSLEQGQFVEGPGCYLVPSWLVAVALLYGIASDTGEGRAVCLWICRRACCLASRGVGSCVCVGVSCPRCGAAVGMDGSEPGGVRARYGTWLVATVTVPEV